jgi:oligopeptide transport system substrate-binding protein
MLRILLILTLLLSSCHKASAPASTQVLRINIGLDPQTLDPRKARELTAVTLIRMFFEGLTRTSKTGALEMALAESVEVSEDGLQYVFRLRKSFWSNGDVVTSFDFAESWKTILDPQFPTDIASQLYAIKNARKAKLGEIGLEQVGIYTPDPQTLVVVLEQQIPYFLQLLSMTSYFPVPHNVVGANPNWAQSPETFVCNGPFFPKTWKHSDLMQVSKNPRYWEAKDVSLQGINLYMMGADTELQMFEAGKLDWAGSPLSVIPAEAVRTLRASDSLNINPFSATYFYRVNTSDKIKERKNPLSSVSFRKALAFALDREGITEHILQGGHYPAKGLVPPEMGLSEKGYFRDDYSQVAHSLLMDALLELDLTTTNLEPIVITYCHSERNAAIAQAIQKQWEAKLGIKVELEAIEQKVFFQRISQKDYQLAAGSWTADFGDPINFLEVFKYKDASTNNTNWESAKYIDLLNTSALCRDLEERKGLLREAEQILMEQMPIIPIFHFALNYLQRDGLEEVALSPLGQIDFRWARLDSEPSLEKK